MALVAPPLLESPAVRRLPPALCLLLVACVNRAELEHCAIDDAFTEPLPEVVTWAEHVGPIVEARCARCHHEGGIGPFRLTTYEEVFALREAVRWSVVSRQMPPWMPAPCCNTFLDDFSLTERQIAMIDAWVEQGAPEGDPARPGPALEPVGGLSRVDVTVEMPEPYTPEPEAGRIDDFRCFAVDWPVDEPVYVTGLEPRPGARAILHHLVVAVATGDDAEAWDDLESEDGRPGVPCEGGLGDLPFTQILGGSLLGGDFPEDVAIRVEPDSRIILNVHYSMSDAAPVADQTQVDLRIEPATEARAESGTLVLANPAWLVSDAMRIPAGRKNVEFAYQYDPRLYTGNDPVDLVGFTPHMHALGQRMIAAVVRKDGTTECLADIPAWDFGWEQPYWFERPVRLEPGDDVYIECAFDNTDENQPVVDGVRQPARDVAWGTDNQDMCVGFVTFVKRRS